MLSKIEFTITKFFSDTSIIDKSNKKTIFAFLNSYK